MSDAIRLCFSSKLLYHGDECQDLISRSFFSMAWRYLFLSTIFFFFGGPSRTLASAGK